MRHCLRNVFFCKQNDTGGESIFLGPLSFTRVNVDSKSEIFRRNCQKRGENLHKIRRSFISCNFDAKTIRETKRERKRNFHYLLSSLIFSNTLLINESLMKQSHGSLTINQVFFLIIRKKNMLEGKTPNWRKRRSRHLWL